MMTRYTQQKTPLPISNEVLSKYLSSLLITILVVYYSAKLSPQPQVLEAFGLEK